MNVFKVALTQKHIGLIEKQQSLPVFSKLKDERKLPLELLWIVAQIPGRDLQKSA